MPAFQAKVVKTEPKIEKIALPAMTEASSNNGDEHAKAIQAANQLDRQLRECNRMEFLRSKLPITPHTLVELREKVLELREYLSETLKKQSLDQASIQKQCHSLKELEKEISVTMSAYEEAAAMKDYQAFSLLDKYGNKHKNLIKLKFIVEALGLPDVVVPGPKAVSSDQVLRFLNIYAPEIFEEWKKIQKLYANHPENILEKPEVQSHLKAIEAGIHNAFVKAAHDEETLHSLFPPEFIAWLKEVKTNGSYLMVRSTGAEDSKKNANAGGNDSVAYVKTTQEDVSLAFSKVVDSYFGINSLQRRLDTGINPFDQELKAAVTAQELIGETIGGAKDPNEIPISLVLFTNEPLYIGEEKFRAMRLSATYGHGEGVVGNQGIASDTVLILNSVSDPSKLYILYDNQEKPERLAPVMVDGKITLQKIANSKEMANRRALDNNLLTRLYELGVISEKFFEDYPTDMEIVIKGGIIYPIKHVPSTVRN